MKKIRILLFVLLSAPLLANAAGEETLMGNLKGFTKSFKEHDGYLDVGLRMGYISGFTSFDFNHHVSELEYPFRCYLGGGKLALGYKDISANSEFWGSMVNDPSAGWHMKDKDWDSNGNLESYTKSNSNMNAAIWDANLRYNFFKKYAVKLGGLIGYRYQRYGMHMDGSYNLCTWASPDGSGTEVFEYKIEYHLPYYGLAADIGNDKFGVLMSAKYAFSARAKDLDNHILIPRTNYADYRDNPNVFMANFILFWKFSKNWEANLGGDAALIRINGNTWDDSHAPAWSKDQNLDAKQFIYWAGLNYRF